MLVKGCFKGFRLFIFFGYYLPQLMYDYLKLKLQALGSKAEKIAVKYTWVSAIL